MTRSDIPQTHTINPIDQPASNSPTAAMLKADINSGASGDKNEVFRGGFGYSSHLVPVGLGSGQETILRWSSGRKIGIAHNKRDGSLTFFVGLIAVVGVILASGNSMGRV